MRRTVCCSKMTKNKNQLPFDFGEFFCPGANVRWKKNTVCEGTIKKVKGNKCLVRWPGPYEMWMPKADLVIDRPGHELKEENNETG